MRQSLDEILGGNSSQIASAGTRPSLDEIFGDAPSSSPQPTPVSTSQLQAAQAGTAPAPKPKNNGDYFGKGLVDFASNVNKAGQEAQSGLGRGFMQGVGNTISAVGQVVDPVTNINRLAQTASRATGGDGNNDILPKDWQVVEGGTGAVKQGTDYLANESIKQDKAKGLNPNSLPANVGGFGGQLISQAPAMALSGGAAGLAEGAASTVPVLSKVAPYVGALAGGAVTTEGVIAADKGRIANFDELKNGAILDTVLHGGAAALKNAAPWIYRTAVNATAANSSKMKEYAEKAIDMGFTGSHEAIKAKTEAVINEVGPKLAETYNQSKAVFNPQDLIKGSIDKAAQLEKAGAGKKANAIVQHAQDFLSTLKPEINASELWKIKQVAQNEILSNLSKGTVLNTSQSAQKQLWGSIYDEASHRLEQAVPEAKALNEAYSVASSVGKATEKQLVKAPGNVFSEGFKALVKSPTITTNLASAAHNAERFTGPVVSNLIKNLTMGRPDKKLPATKSPAKFPSN